MQSLQSLFLILLIGQGSIAERTQLSDPRAMFSSEWKSWVKAQGADISGMGESASQFGPFSGGFFERLDLLAFAQGKRIQVRHRSFQMVPGSKGIIAQGSSFCRGEVESVVVGNQLDESRDYLKVGIQAAWHPKLHPILVQAGAFQFSSKDSKPYLSRGTSWQAVEEDFAAHLELVAAKPPRSLKGFDSLEGGIRLVVPQQLLWLELGGIRESEGTGHQVGKTKVKRLRTQVTSKRVSLEVEIWPGPSEYQLDSYQESILTGLASMVGPDNVKRNADGQQILESGEGKMRVRYDWLTSRESPWEGQLVNQRFVLRIGDNYKEIETRLKFGALDLP